MTAGNTEKRYIGRTDEPLCEEGKKALKERSSLKPDIVITSPMKRCVQTAKLLFDGVEPVTEEDLREVDFGAFEGRNYSELIGDHAYQSWLDSGGKMRFPGGEDPAEFKKRCTAAFLGLVKRYSELERIAFVVHGGTIMAILEEFVQDGKTFYDYHVENGCGYLTEYKDGHLEIISILQ